MAVFNIMEPSFDTPILMIMFNRPNHAIRVFESIKQIRPTQLFLAVDGPRHDHINEIDNVVQCRQLADAVDWPCQVETLFKEENLGCKKAVSSAINWFFKHVEHGIILEDDCLPNATFFDYCSILLRKYANDSRIMHICGHNLYGDIKWGTSSYFFTNIPHIWGWATWRRAWINYDVNMLEYPDFERSGGIERAVLNTKSQVFWKKDFNKVYAGKMDTWDYQWVFAVWKCGGLCVTPNQNLISNIGFDEAATHTKTDSEMANLPTVPLNVHSIVFPTQIQLHREATEYAFSHFYQIPSWWVEKFKALRRLVITKFIKRNY